MFSCLHITNRKLTSESISPTKKSNFSIVKESFESFPAIIQQLPLFFCTTKQILLTLYFPPAHQLHDVDVKVGKRTHRMRLCGHITGYTRTGGRMAVWCPNHTVGRYVQIQIVKGVSNYLSPAEVVVWGKPVNGGF